MSRARHGKGVSGTASRVGAGDGTLGADGGMPVADTVTGSDTGTEAAGSFWLPLAVLTAVVVASALGGVLPVWPGLVHLVALPPLDLFGDFRVLLTSASSWTSFAALLAAVLAARVILLALMLGGLTRKRIVLAAGFYAVLAPLLLLAAQVVYIANTLLYSRLFWAGLVAVVVLAFLFSPAPWQVTEERAPRVRDALARTWRGGLRVEVTLAYAAAVVAIGALAHLFPALAVPLVPASAAATAMAVAALSRPAPARPLLRLGAAVTALVIVGTVWVTTRGTGPPEVSAPREGSIMVMSGIDSRSGIGDMFGSRTGLLGYTCEQTHYFSYAGAGDGQPQREALCPIRTGAPYAGEDTQRPVDEQVEAFADQVRDLPRPLVVAGHSQGAWIAWKAVATGAAPEVDTLLLVGPFPESTGGYRPFGEPGPGQPASDLLHLLVPLAREIDFHFEADSPTGYELLGTTDAPAGIFALEPPERVGTLSVTSSSDLPLMPSGWRLPVDRNACPMRTPHAYIPTTPAYYDEVNRFLDGDPGLACPVFRDWGGPITVPFSLPVVRIDPFGDQGSGPAG